MKRAYVTYLGSDDFLPGILALYQSLKDVHSKERLTVLLTSDISNDIKALLTNLDIRVKQVEHIINPENPHGSANFKIKNSYTKLHIFNLAEYQKVVYLDCDMLVCNNIDELFEKPHFSAVNAGGMLREYSDWVDLNAGLLVIKPSVEVFKDLMSKVGILSSKSCGDQGFLHSYFPEWPNHPECHLNHGYNLYVGHLDKYNKLYNYVFPDDYQPSTTTINVLHFWGIYKPWLKNSLPWIGKYHKRAFEMWHECYNKIREELHKTISKKQL